MYIISTDRMFDAPGNGAVCSPDPLQLPRLSENEDLTKRENSFRRHRPMTRISFHQKLDSLRERLLQMAGVAEQTLHLALDAHCRGELSACANVRLNEAIINRSEREIDQMALDLLAMEQPMAVDLRFVLAAIKINSDLERVGDQSMTIALLAEEL